MPEHYLDNSATTKVLPEVAELMNKIYLEEYGNPSSMHHKGVEAEKELRLAKERLAGVLHCAEKNLVFTSCGSESDNLAIIGTAMARKRYGRHLITTKVEHPAVLETMRFLESEGFEVTYLPVDGNGRVSPESVTAAMRDDTILVSTMLVNNEIGAVNDVAAIGKAVKERNSACYYHVDAVQAFGKMEIRPKQMHIDFLAASGHKIHAAKGVGLLYIGDGVHIRNIIFGGGQQGGMRSGTENVAGIAGMALAAKILYDHLPEDRARLYALKDRFIQGVSDLPDTRINGLTGEDAAPHVISLSVRGVRAEVLLHALEDREIYVSSGSACSSNRPHVSDTLTAIGVPAEDLDSTIRISTSVLTTEDDIDACVSALTEIVPMLRRYTRH